MELPAINWRPTYPGDPFFREGRPAFWATALLIFAAVIGALQFRTAMSPFSGPVLGAYLTRTLPVAQPSATAFGTSGKVVLRFALPASSVEYPLEVRGDPTALQYAWVRLGESFSREASRPLLGASLVAPEKPGFYQLALVRGEQSRPVPGLTLAVLVPFTEKQGSMLNGYRIGTYLAERLSGKQEPPEGFLEITPNDLNLRISEHLRVSDFLTHDGQSTWPRYAAVSPRLLDKIELVIAELVRWHDNPDAALAVKVQSGFRAPEHNRRVARAASDSQHQYGDAADISIDANGDGKFTGLDSHLVGLAVEIVELKHPELVGGLGIYASGHTRTAFVHIDARGKRVRWRG